MDKMYVIEKIYSPFECFQDTITLQYAKFVDFYFVSVERKKIPGDS
jgi:hypothetical protein